MVLYYLLVYLFPLHYTQEVPLLFKKTLEYTFKPYSPYHTLELGGSLTNKSKFPIKVRPYFNWERVDPCDTWPGEIPAANNCQYHLGVIALLLFYWVGLFDGNFDG